MKHCLPYLLHFFSNSLIIHKNHNREGDFNPVSIEKIYQTLETVFHRLSKHLEFRQKYSAARRIFNSFLGFLYPDETLS